MYGVKVTRTDSLSVLSFGPFTTREAAEQAMIALIANHNVQSAVIIEVDGSEDGSACGSAQPIRRVVLHAKDRLGFSLSLRSVPANGTVAFRCHAGAREFVSVHLDADQVRQVVEWCNAWLDHSTLTERIA